MASSRRPPPAGPAGRIRPPRRPDALPTPSPARRPPPGASATGPQAEPLDPSALAEAIASWAGHPSPLPLPMIDGLLVGVLLQRRPVPVARWWPAVFDGDGRGASGPQAEPLRSTLARRHAELDAAIGRRQWFDPWILEPAEGETVHDAVYPWVAGFAQAMAVFEDLGDTDDPAFEEPLALLYQHLDAEDLEDADTLLDIIDALPPPQDLGEAVEQLVRATLLIADETRPLASAGRAR